MEYFHLLGMEAISWMQLVSILNYILGYLENSCIKNLQTGIDFDTIDLTLVLYHDANKVAYLGN